MNGDEFAKLLAEFLAVVVIACVGVGVVALTWAVVSWLI